MTEAATEVNQEVSAICGVCNGRAYTAGGFIWSSKKVKKVSLPSKNYITVQVEQIDIKTGKVIKTWEAIKEAERALSISNVYRAAKYNRTAGGYKWNIVK